MDKEAYQANQFLDGRNKIFAGTADISQGKILVTGALTLHFLSVRDWVRVHSSQSDWLRYLWLRCLLFSVFPPGFEVCYIRKALPYFPRFSFLRLLWRQKGQPGSDTVLVVLRVRGGFAVMCRAVTADWLSCCAVTGDIMRVTATAFALIPSDDSPSS